MCEWCGHQHPVTALCTKRPRWGRRGFIALLGAAVVGAALPAVSESASAAQAFRAVIEVNFNEWVTLATGVKLPVMAAEWTLARVAQR